MSVESINFKRKDEVLNLKITHTSGNTTVLDCEYFGKLESFDAFIAFWKSGKEIPSLVLAERLIAAIEVFEEEESDNS